MKSRNHGVNLSTGHWLIVFITIILITGSALTLWTAQQQDQNMREDLLIRTRLAAAGINSSQVASLTGSSLDLDSPDYLSLKQQMADLRHADPDISFTYLIGQKPDGTYFFFVDSEPSDSPDCSPPGQSYPEITALLASVYTTGNEQTEGPETDRWGTWISGIVPVSDTTHDGRVAVFGMDVDANLWNQHIIVACLPPITGFLLVLVLVLSFFYVHQRNEQERRRLNVSRQALRKSEEEFRVLYDDAPSAYFSMDINGVIVRCNKKAAQITGIPVEKIIGMNAIDLYADRPEGKERAMTIFSRFVDGETIFNEELLMQHVDGTPRWVSFSANPVLDQKGGLSEIRSMFIDITERKNAEEALRVINNKLNLLSSITRHDILNQVSAAQIYIDIIKTEGEIPLDSKITENLEIIDDALATIEQQIAFTHDYQDLGIHSPEWFDVNAILSTWVSGANGVVIVDKKVENIEIYADPLFEKVIYNLYDNALRHGEKETTIRFRSEQSQGGLKLICEDDGIGVPEDVKEKIFNRQYYQHTGLGLFLSREILSITGMTITETGIPGKGARFEIFVPDGMWRLV